MQFKIKDENAKLKFGVKFVRLMDEKYKIDYQGLEFGMGVMHAQMGLAQRSVPTLSDIIHAATKGEYLQEEVDDAVEEHAEKEGLKKLFKQIEDELGKSPVVQETLKALKEANKKAQNAETSQSKPTKK